MCVTLHSDLLRPVWRAWAEQRASVNNEGSGLGAGGEWAVYGNRMRIYTGAAGVRYRLGNPSAKSDR